MDSEPVAPHIHCWHETARITHRGTLEDSFMLKSEHCCFCPAEQDLKLYLKKDPRHGPYAPLVWGLGKCV